MTEQKLAEIKQAYETGRLPLEQHLDLLADFVVGKKKLKLVKGLANICAQSSQYRGMEYPCANIDMQDRLISLVNAGIPDGKSELELKNNGFKSGRAYKLIQKEQQQLLNVVINEICLH
ncbi:unnamed protein product [Rotaria socialis]|uniref:Uncharacterized protein n=1 Tax=Rotaria socialis TaxID=392032 RepID=A0A818R2P6_9BILA|nr:unnamed protein product [Rotaria socialis]